MTEANDQPVIDSYTSVVKDQMSEEVFESVLLNGGMSELEDAVAYALEKAA